MPTHPIVSQFEITHDHFYFLWRDFHFTVENNEETDLSETDDNDDEMVVISLERIQIKQEEEDDSKVVSDSGNRKVWYEELTFLIDHVRAVSLSLIYTLGTTL
eukprot:15330788-Ditylum_brightwellii.AAC.1